MYLRTKYQGSIVLGAVQKRTLFRKVSLFLIYLAILSVAQNMVIQSGIEGCSIEFEVDLEGSGSGLI
jgi:hypothetical protein